MESRQQIDADFEKQRKLQQELLGVNSTIDQLKQEVDSTPKILLAYLYFTDIFTWVIFVTLCVEGS